MSAAVQGVQRMFSLHTGHLRSSDIASDRLSGAKVLAKDATVCVHMATDRVGVRELRQNLSRYLRRVARGSGSR